MSTTETLLRLLVGILVSIIAGLLVRYIPKRHSLKVLILAVVTVVLYFIINLPRPQTVVPDVTYLFRDQAAKECRDLGLIPSVRDGKEGEWSKDVGVGKVLDQLPKPGAMVDRGRVITLTISLGPPAASPSEDKTGKPCRTHGKAKAK
ncbi:MAG TPA: PASTA domain-containing protein [Candidatus Sulfotelmatobacter sp.]